MAKQYKYRKIIDAVTTHCLLEPDYELLKIEERVQVIGELDGFTYVSVPDSIKLPVNQPILLIPADLEADKINAKVVEKIRAKYSINDEIKMLRTAVPEDTAKWTAYVEECRSWGDKEKQLLSSVAEVKK